MGKVRPKVRGKRNVVDEWEHADIDRDEQKAGLKRRERRWKEILKEQELEKKAEKEAIKNAEKMGSTMHRQPNIVEDAWLRCDYILNNIMKPKAYAFMEHQRKANPDMYKKLYKIFMSPNMMTNMQNWVNFFAAGQKVAGQIPLSEVIKHYKKLKGIKNTIKIVHKGEKDRDL